MSKVPLLLVQQHRSNERQTESLDTTEIIAIAVYNKNTAVPMPVSTQRNFSGDNQFKFPTEITQGPAKTRILYRYNISQWRELLETTTMPSSPGGIKQLMIPLLLHMQKILPDVFADINYDRYFDPQQYAEVIIME